MMWREESGFLEMFLAYYSQFEENVSGGKAYRDFLLDVLREHEMSLSGPQREALDFSTPSSNQEFKPAPSGLAQKLAVKQELEEADCEDGSFGKPFREKTQTEEMWREESGFLEMFLAYYSQFEENVSGGKAYRDFLLDVLSTHEMSLSFPIPGGHIKAEPDDLDCSDFPCFEERAANEEMEAMTGFAKQMSEQLCNNAVFPDNENQASRDFQLQQSASPDVPKALPLPRARRGPKASNRTYQCDVCLKTFSNNSNLRSHTRVHTGERPFACRVCGKTFSQSAHLRIHERIHSGERPYRCEFCNKGFSAIGNLRQHERIHTGDQPFECAVCKKSFTHSGSLRKHEHLHAGEGPFECETCHKVFPLLPFLRHHLKVHMDLKPFQCNICKKVFPHSASLQKHKRFHSAERPYQCDVCKKTFSDASSLKKHKKIHSSDRPFECKVCKKAFLDPGHLRTHEINHKLKVHLLRRTSANPNEEMEGP